MADREIAFETVKLLLQVAWADDDVGAEETEFVITYARKSGLDDDTIAGIRAALAGDRALPAPNIALLREHRHDVLVEVRELIAADDEVADDELETLRMIEEMLA